MISAPRSYPPRRVGWSVAIGLLLAASWCVGILGRSYWTPDEPREADLAWRMSWQPDKAVPLLAGEPFCEKPPLTYWVAGAAIAILGDAAWVARLPNVIYALVTALAVGTIGMRAAGTTAAIVSAAAISTFLLSYQVGIWLATDAPLLAAVAVALVGLYRGFYADGREERLRGYTLMHTGLAIGFLSKSAAAWMVPVIGILGLAVWEKRLRELARWELYVGLILQAALILPWVGFVAAGPDGTEHLKVFFWNNLAGRFAHVDAPEGLQYATAHRNSPAKYLIELPVYLWPWTLLMAAAVRRAWIRRNAGFRERRLVRFAAATFLPTLGLLSIAATARNIYLAPALPGAALLLAWWVCELPRDADGWDLLALRATAVLMLVSVATLAAATIVVATDAGSILPSGIAFALLSFIGLGVCTGGAIAAWRAAGRRSWLPAAAALLVAYCAVLIGPALSIYRRVDTWQNLEALGRAIRRDSIGHPLILFAQDETTRAFIDMYTRTDVDWIPGPATPRSTEEVRTQLAAEPQSLVVVQLPGKNVSSEWRAVAMRLGGSPAREPAPPEWIRQLNLSVVHRYGLPNGRRYALLAMAPR